MGRGAGYSDFAMRVCALAYAAGPAGKGVMGLGRRARTRSCTILPGMQNPTQEPGTLR
jgi:hypothetical protein